MKYTVCLSCIIWNLKPKHSPSVMTCLLMSSYSVWIIRTRLYRSQEGCVSKLFSSDRKAQTMPAMRCNRASLMQPKIQQFGTIEASLTLNIGKHKPLTYRPWIGLRFMPLCSSWKCLISSQVICPEKWNDNSISFKLISLFKIWIMISSKIILKYGWFYSMISSSKQWRITSNIWLKISLDTYCKNKILAQFKYVWCVHVEGMGPSEAEIHHQALLEGSMSTEVCLSVLDVLSLFIQCFKVSTHT